MTQTIPRQIRVFISSTFRDMQAERDYLVKFIFPQLRKLCESRAVTWGEVDLRWGITDEQSAEGQVLPICLAEIERSRPYFIGLLGERYGWIPDAIDPELIEREPWLAQHLDHSVTELEILHGVLNDPQMTHHALFYFRDPDYIHTIEDSQRDDFVEVPWRSDIETYGMADAQKRVAQRQAKLLRLKDRIRQSGLPVKENYRDPEQLGEWVLADLTRIINQLFPEDARPDALSREASLHEAFAQSRARLYIGAEHYFAKLDQHATQPSLPLVLLGESGSGKSALLANWSLKYQNDHPDDFVLTHFIGASPDSTDLSNLLLRLMSALKQHFDLPGNLPQSGKQLRQALPNWLAMAGAKGKLVLVLDGLNQLDSRDAAQELDWLPLELPENVAIFLSTLPCRALEVIQERAWPSLSVLPLSLDERAQIVRQYLLLFSKQLSPSRLQRIIEDPQSQNPLALRLLLDELRQFGKHEQLDAIIERFLAADSIPEMLQLQLERLEEDFEKDHPGLVRQALSLLWAARFGLSETELLDLLGEPGQPLPGRLWSPLSLALESSLVDRGGLLSFFHDYLRQAVEARYLKDEESKNQAHIALADYFESLEDTSDRKLDELPWQLSQAKAWLRLYEILKDPDFLLKFLIDFRSLDLTSNQLTLYQLEHYWSQIERNSEYRVIESYSDVVTNPVYAWITGWLIEFLPKIGHIREAEQLIKIDNARENQGAIKPAWWSVYRKAELLLAEGRLDEVSTLVDELYVHYEKNNKEYCLMNTLEIQGNLLIDKKKPVEALEVISKLEKLCIQNDNDYTLHKIIGNKGNALAQLGREEEALGLYKKSEKFWRSLGELNFLSISLFNQSLHYLRTDDIDKAWDLLIEQERYCRRTGDLRQLQKSLGLKANILHKKERHSELLIVLKERGKILKQLQDLPLMDSVLTEQADVLVALNQFEQAYQVILEQENILRELGDPTRLVDVLGNKAWLLRRLDKNKKALSVLSEMERIAKSNQNVNGRIRSLTERASILGNAGRLKEMLTSLKKLEQLLSSIRDWQALKTNLEYQIAVSEALGEQIHADASRAMLEMVKTRL